MVTKTKSLLQNFLRVISPLKALLTAFVFASSFCFAFAANITLSPTSVSTKVNKTFSLDVLISGNQDPINAVSGVITFPTDALQVVSLSKTGSFVNMWPEEPAYSNKDGTVSFEGVALNPGFSGVTGKVVTVTFKAKQAGNISILVKSGSVLANDGNATNVLGTTGSAFVVINEDTLTQPSVSEPKVAVTSSLSVTPTPVITSAVYPDSNKWYSSKEASFEWEIPKGVTAIKTLYGDKELSKPTKVYDPPVTNRSFVADTDGIMYMHAQFKDASGWGPIAHYKFQIDTEGPETLQASFPDGILTTNPSPAVLVLAGDKLSGVASITVAIDSDQPVVFPVDPSNLYRLPKKLSGRHTAVIGATDYAGNTSTVTLEYTIQTISPPTITEYTKKVDFDNQLKVSGTTYPQTTVEISLANSDGKVETMTTMSNDAGQFNLVWTKKLATDVYEMHARAVDSKGSTSDYTENKIVIVEHVVLVRVGIFIMNWLSVILIVIVSAVSVVGTLWYAFVQFAYFRRRTHRVIREAENTLKLNVAALRKDTEEFHLILVKAERKRELTKEEQAILRKFKKRLEITEKEIEKKLEAIDE